MTTIPVLGIPVRFAWDDARIERAVERAFGRWRGLDPALVADDPVDVRIDTVEGDEGGHAVPPLEFDMPAWRRVRVRSRGSSGEADAEERRVVANVTSAMLDAEQHFRYGMLEALTLALLTRLDRQPFHAAAIVRDGHALLLAGPSGAGKSTLSYAAVRHGYRLLSEDAVYVQMQPPRIWGLPGFLHLPESSRDQLSELRDAEPVLLANGKRKIAVPLSLGDLAEVPVVEQATVVLLERGSGGPRLERVSAEMLGEALFRRTESGFDVFASTIRGALAPFLEGGGFRLWVGGLPGDCVAVLRRGLGED